MFALYKKTAATMVALLMMATSAAASDPTTCVVGLVKHSISPVEPFSYVRDGSPGPAIMSCHEAQALAGPLNLRHNNNINGIEPVAATVFLVLEAGDDVIRIRPK